ncbi:DUF1453 family protein [Nakamurella deserti]|uniref:DUF1453 family protein n=1 Tax=Nakamurella deserti TaxID=2164074 RepID=UPI000DBE9075|nr:DUF1453 family protein [Nakamurella deserti]
MSIYELLGVLALTGYAVYQQTRRHQVVARTRFTLALIYGVAGVISGGLHLPPTGLAVTFLVISLLLSLIVGQVRGRLTRLWVEDGRIWSQGTTLTVSLFLALIASKFVLGTVAYFAHVSENGGIGEVLLMLAVMMAIQAQLIHRRAQRLAAQQPAGGIAGVTR